MRIAIMTDTNSGITVDEGKQMGIFVLPMPVIIDEVSYLEGIDITHSQLYDALKNHLTVSSSQPSPASVMDMWDEILKKGYDEIVYIPMTSGLSGSCHTAMQLATEYGSRVQVADNHRISVPLVDSILDAKYLADHEMNAAAIKKRLEANAYQSTIYITVNSLEYLKKSGRITPAAASIATVINLKPILTIQGEKLDSYAKVRGIHQSGKKMIDAIKKDIEHRFSSIPVSRLSIGTAGTFDTKEAALEWYEQVKEAFPQYSVHYSPLSCSIASHVGINAMGISATVIEDR